MLEQPEDVERRAARHGYRRAHRGKRNKRINNVPFASFEACDAPKLHRDFVKGKGRVEVRQGQVTVTFPKRAHNPILRAVPWQQLPRQLPWLGDATLNLEFR